MSMKLYTGGLPYSVTDEELQKMFAEFGTVVSAVVIKDRDSGQSKGFGFVEMETEDQGAAAIAGLHDKDVGGRKLTVSQARPQEDRPSGGGSRS